MWPYGISNVNLKAELTYIHSHSDWRSYVCELAILTHPPLFCKKIHTIGSLASIIAKYGVYIFRISVELMLKVLVLSVRFQVWISFVQQSLQDSPEFEGSAFQKKNQLPPDNL